MSIFHGVVNPNAILRGETNVLDGDTFVQESEDRKGFCALVYKPKYPEPEKPYMHFSLVSKGTYEKCKLAALSV